MAWAHQDCDRTHSLGEQQKNSARRIKDKLHEEKELRQKAEESAETQAAELEVARAELKAAKAELAKLKESSSKHRGDTMIEIS